jgi:hypothetical protein
MAINYPTSLDSFTNPTATDLLTSPSHAQQHSDINDAMEAVQTKLAIGNTVIGTYTAYTPPIGGFTIGNGTRDTKYCRVNNFVHYTGLITFGSTSTFAGSFFFNVPITGDFTTSQPIGTSYIRDASTGVTYAGIVRPLSTFQAYGSIHSSDIGGWLRFRAVSATDPMTWATGDQIGFNIYYKVA